MLLRLILVGLVTSLSLELPTGSDVSSWAESGRAWANARIAASETPTVAVVEPAAIAVADPIAVSAQADQDFQDVVDAMAASFSVAAMDQGDEPQVAAAPAEASAVTPVEVVEVVEVAKVVEVVEVAKVAEVVTVADGVADDATALPAGEELATVTAADPAGEPEVVAVVTEVVVIDEVIVAEDAATPRADRLADAVRLTRAAVEAWTAVMAGPADATDCSR